MKEVWWGGGVEKHVGERENVFLHKSGYLVTWEISPLIHGDKLESEASLCHPAIQHAHTLIHAVRWYTHIHARAHFYTQVTYFQSQKAVCI